MGQNSSYELLSGKDQQRCSKCRKPIVNSESKRLSCRHTFCNQCISDDYGTSIVREPPIRRRIRCPVCSKLTSFSDDATVVDVTSLVDKPVCIAHTPTPQSTVDATRQRSSATEAHATAVPSTMDMDSGDKESPLSAKASNRDVILGKSPLSNKSETGKPALSSAVASPSGTAATTTPSGTTDSVKSPRKRGHPETTDESSGNDEFQDTSQELPVAPKEDLHLCAVCKHSKPKRKKSEASFYCFDCTSPMCDGCREKHACRPRCKGHVVCPVTKDNIVALVCQKHQEYAEDYCIDCKTVTCAECHVSLHKGHNIRDFTAQAVETVMFRELAQRKAKNVRTLESLDVAENSYSEELTNTKNEMKKCRNDVIGTINTHFESMFNILDDAHFKWKDSIDNVRRNIQTEEKLLDELQEKAYRLVSPIADVTDLHIRNAQDLLIGLNKELPHNEHVFNKHESFIYIPEEGIKRQCGQLVQVPSTRASNS